MSYTKDPFLLCKIEKLLNSKVSIVSETPILVDSETNNPIGFFKIFGVITDKTLESNDSNPDFNMYFLKIDDGTGALWIKSNDQLLTKIQKWDFTQVVGSLVVENTSENSFDLTINPESVTVMEDKSWELVHNLDIKIKGSKVKKKSDSIMIDMSTENKNSQKNHATQGNEFQKLGDVKVPLKLDTLSSKIEEILRNNDSGDGVEFSEVIKLLKGVDESEVDDILFELAYEGKVYQPKPDYYKIMD